MAGVQVLRISLINWPAAAYWRFKQNRVLTEASVEPLGLVLPVDAQVVDGHARQHDQQADATHQGLGVEREDQQEAPEQQADDRPHQADLQDTSTSS